MPSEGYEEIFRTWSYERKAFIEANTLKSLKKQILQDKLQADLDVENYEQAAILRDELKKLG